MKAHIHVYVQGTRRFHMPAFCQFCSRLRASNVMALVYSTEVARTSARVGKSALTGTVPNRELGLRNIVVSCHQFLTKKPNI